MILWWATLASASVCPFGTRVQDVSATMTSVSIDGKTWSVRGQPARLQFVSVLRECGADEATIGSFLAWRGLRRATNICVAAACGLAVQGIVGGIVTGLMAHDRQQDFLTALKARYP